MEIIKWEHLSSLNSDLSFACVGEQVVTLIFDIDKDGKNDFVIAGWGKPSMVWYRHVDGHEFDVMPNVRKHAIKKLTRIVQYFNYKKSILKSSLIE